MICFFEKRYIEKKSGLSQTNVTAFTETNPSKKETKIKETERQTEKGNGQTDGRTDEKDVCWLSQLKVQLLSISFREKSKVFSGRKNVKIT